MREEPHIDRVNFGRSGVVDNNIRLVVRTNNALIIVYDNRNVKLCESLFRLLSELERNNAERESRIRKVLGIVAGFLRILPVLWILWISYHGFNESHRVNDNDP